ncbi:hypothetical protein HanRHA438_Chr12g0542591 [Helianthus annuus]|nr:hypothetical protein HanRHA438_Chr12g0542591 [Helianthus annuus]
MIFLRLKYAFYMLDKVCALSGSPLLCIEINVILLNTHVPYLAGFEHFVSLVEERHFTTTPCPLTILTILVSELCEIAFLSLKRY